jgi:signal transduction histidine kinase
MWQARLERIAGARYARVAGVALLAAAAVGQVAAMTLTTSSAPVTGGAVRGQQTSLPATPTLEQLLALTLLALVATVPLAFYRPAMAALAVTFGNAVALGSFGQVTAAGAAAELIAAWWLGLAGASGNLRAVRWPGWLTGRTRRGGASPRGGRGDERGGRGEGPGNGSGGWHGGRRGLAVTPGRYLAVGLTLPFLAIALARGGWTAVSLAAAVPVAAGLGIVAWAERLARTRTAAGEALADTLLAHTARGERARIARELHDVVAHHISMIAVLSETGRLTTPGLPEAGARRFTEIGDTARAGLTEMRRLLGVLREDAAAAEEADDVDVGREGQGSARRPPAAATGSGAGAGAGSGAVGAGAGAAPGTAARRASRQPQPGLAQLTGLIDAARDASLAGTRLIISGPVTPLDPGVELAAYRIVQEALTNARRHAPGAAVDVELRYSPEWLRLRVRDNGPGPVSAAGAWAAAGGTGQAASGRPGPEPADAGLPGDELAGTGLPGTRLPSPGSADGERVGAGAVGGAEGGQPTSGGHGLAGMRERAFSVGGSLYVGLSPGGGFLVEAVLPADRNQAGVSRAAGEAGGLAGPAGGPVGDSGGLAGPAGGPVGDSGGLAGPADGLVGGGSR